MRVQKDANSSARGEPRAVMTLVASSPSNSTFAARNQTSASDAEMLTNRTCRIGGGDPHDQVARIMVTVPSRPIVDTDAPFPQPSPDCSSQANGPWPYAHHNGLGANNETGHPPGGSAWLETNSGETQPDNASKATAKNARTTTNAAPA